MTYFSFDIYTNSENICYVSQGRHRGYFYISCGGVIFDQNELCKKKIAVIPS